MEARVRVRAISSSSDCLLADKLDRYNEFRGKGFYDRSIPLYTIPERAGKAMKRAYYASISYVDEQVGRILEELE